MRRLLKNIEDIEDNNLAELQNIAAAATRSASQRAVEILKHSSGAITVPAVKIPKGRKVKKGTVIELKFNKQKKTSSQS